MNHIENKILHIKLGDENKIDSLMFSCSLPTGVAALQYMHQEMAKCSY